MGWDVTTIGLSHTLPIDDAKALAQDLSQRLNQNIKLGYWEWIDYNPTTKQLSIKQDEFVEMDRFIVDVSKPFHYLSIYDYQERIIRERFSRKDLKQMDYKDKYLRGMLLRINEPFAIYQLEDEERMEWSLSFFREHIDLGLPYPGRWSRWAQYFTSNGNEQTLGEYRQEVADLARALGCKDVVYFADQGPTQNIYELLNSSRQELTQYIDERCYLFDNEELTKEEQKEFLNYGKVIWYADYFEGNLNFSDQEFVEIVYDDFRGLKALD